MPLEVNSARLLPAACCYFSAIDRSWAGVDGVEQDNYMRINMVLIDDDCDWLDLCTRALTRPMIHITSFTDPKEGLKAVLRNRPEIVLLDVRMPGADGKVMLEDIVERAPGTTVIMVTGFYTETAAMEALEKGASDYLSKSLPLSEIRARVHKFIEERVLLLQSKILELERLKTCRFEGMIGSSPALVDVFGRARRIAPHFSTVLITGETGTGKELLARALHKFNRESGPFITCDCSTLTETLLESELFGHVKGAFTGAIQEKKGYFECANGGTLFLDEIGEMTLGGQAKLLRALQEREIRCVGSTMPRKVDVRVIAATNRDLRHGVSDRTFREDLYYRLASVHLGLPRLCDRKEDIPLLEQHFVARYSDRYKKHISRVSSEVHGHLIRYHWPGNVREFENVLAHACMMAQSEVIEVEDLPPNFGQSAPATTGNYEEARSLKEVIRAHSLRVLSETGGHRALAAKILGVSRPTLYRILRTVPSGNLGLNPGSDR